VDEKGVSYARRFTLQRSHRSWMSSSVIRGVYSRIAPRLIQATKLRWLLQDVLVNVRDQ
jgi:hypothetical protein